ncbi:MAG: photosystem II reaction center protein Ycf12 [Cyanothece sp. SIO1E1]|nr:photosystem II reaction center protein Ycf12 [Cyanothece sp. SIO1E1]
METLALAIRYDTIAQLVMLGLIVVAGPIVVAAVAVLRGNL